VLYISVVEVEGIAYNTVSFRPIEKKEKGWRETYVYNVFQFITN
jgi:hypothetical protein